MVFKIFNRSFEGYLKASVAGSSSTVERSTFNVLSIMSNSFMLSQVLNLNVFAVVESHKAQG